MAPQPVYTPPAYTRPPHSYALYTYDPSPTAAPGKDCSSSDPPIICTLALAFGIIVMAGITIAIIYSICKKKC